MPRLDYECITRYIITTKDDVEASVCRGLWECCSFEFTFLRRDSNSLSRTLQMPFFFFLLGLELVQVSMGEIRSFLPYLAEQSLSQEAMPTSHGPLGSEILASLKGKRS